MRNVLIFTHSKDSHVYAVAHVLRLRGVTPVVLNTGNMVYDSAVSVSYHSDAIRIGFGDYRGTVDGVSAVWNRRFIKLFRTVPNLHPSDVSYVRHNAQAVLTGVLGLLDKQFAVNPIASVRIWSNKLLQLRAARAAGFDIPETLVSNNFEDIMSFFSTGEDVCMKSYHTHGWLTNTGPRQTVTVRIGEESAIDRESCQACPQIFQRFVRKKYEYRITLFGAFHVAVRIDTKSLEGDANVDWRASPAYLNKLSIARLPDKVIEAARNLLTILNLRFGIIDLAETYDGDFVFFEVNEAGQWLWQDLHLPGCRTLQPFCEYIASADDRYQWDPGQASPEFEAQNVCKAINDDPEFRALGDETFPDEEIYVADERSLQAMNALP